MSSAVTKLQQDIAEPTSNLTALLRQAKVIASNLGVSDVEAWVDLELKGYPTATKSADLPKYRIVHCTQLEVYNYIHGWRFAGFHTVGCPVHQPAPKVEDFAEGPTGCYLTPPEEVPIFDQTGRPLYGEQQRLLIPSTEFRGVVEAIKNALLDWTVELKKRGINGENMDFNEKEKAAATHQTFNIQNFTGVAGNVSDSTVNVYNYSTLHQTLKEHHVPQDERNKLETIMDQLNEAQPHQKPTLIEQGKAWIVKNKDFLGASAEIVKKAIGG